MVYLKESKIFFPDIVQDTFFYALKYVDIHVIKRSITRYYALNEITLYYEKMRVTLHVA